ncbi:phage baseplate assembly protein V [Rhizobium leguminosarum]|uniref:phage baseplate assembly protein V n=1 Tax=Rhizobium leguminosarum TaxID=384 RepID=UPI001FD88022|nr:phage baseplate assembly protein V [Rhizobium leguminosarum]
MIPTDLPGQIADLYGRLAEIERRARNRKRTGTVDQVDHEKGLYRVKLSGQGGKPFLTDWIKPKQLGAGLVKIDILLKEGEQVDVVSESGDLTDAQIDLSSYSESNPRENSDTPLLIRIGGAVFSMSAEEIVLKAGKIRLEGDIDADEGYLKHIGKNVGHDHEHTDVVQGSDNTGPPA